MRAIILLALVVLLGAACADEPVPEDTPPAGPARHDPDPLDALRVEIVLVYRPENAHPYADDTLARFRKLVEGDGWREPAWNAQGTLEVTHGMTGLAFVLVPEGAFLMGSAESVWTSPVHDVMVPPFLLCTTECPQNSWERGGGSNSSHFKGDHLPVEFVNWEDCVEWCGENGLRLVSEAEWEYACRAGTTTRFSWGDKWDPSRSMIENLERGYTPRAARGVPYYRTREIRIGQTAPIATFAPNGWGFHDMHGNVWEWCADAMAPYGEEPRTSSPHTVSGSRIKRVRRGGSWFSDAWSSASAYRAPTRTQLRCWDLGFRPAASLPPK